MHTIKQVAKLIGTGEQRLFRVLRVNAVLDNDNLPKQRYIERGYFKVVDKQYHHPVVGEKHYGQTLVTDKGVDWIKKEFGPRLTEQAA